MAILGLRSLYFALAGIIHRFYYLRLSLSLLLALIGTKMLLKDILHALPNTTYYTLGAICLILSPVALSPQSFGRGGHPNPARPKCRSPRMDS